MKTVRSKACITAVTHKMRMQGHRLMVLRRDKENLLNTDEAFVTMISVYYD